VIARRILVCGRVQGVGYRFFAERAARDAGVKGWVRNLPDGTVESAVEGDDSAVAAFLDRLREGPRSGRVTELRVEDAEWAGFDSFDITR
jgi:acylphosphatase